MVKLTNNYYIGADKYNWILYEKKKSEKTGEERMEAWKFYPTLENLLTSVLKMKLRALASDKTDLNVWAARLSAETKKFSEHVAKLCKDIKKEDLGE